MENSFFDVLTQSLVFAPGQLCNERSDQSLDGFCGQIFAADFCQLLQEDVDEVKLETERCVKRVNRLFVFVWRLRKENLVLHFHFTFLSY
jgi:hypothetical protein